MHAPEKTAATLRTWLIAARPKTLAAAIAPVLLGTALAVEAGAFHAFAATCALLGAIFIQIGTNFSNDYVDYLKGADTGERAGPLRVTQAGLVEPETMRRATALVFTLAVFAGSYLIWRGGWPILAIGVASILFGILYTAGGRFSLAYLGVADFFVLVFFGPVAVGGTYYVQALEVTPEVLVAGIGPGLLATAILLVNNVRDVEEDRRAGKRTLVVRMGRGAGVGLYAGCFVVAALLPIGLYLWTGANPWSLLAALVLPPGLRAAWRIADRRDPEMLNWLLARTGQLLLLYCVLFGLGWLL